MRSIVLLVPGLSLAFSLACVVPAAVDDADTDETDVLPTDGTDDTDPGPTDDTVDSDDTGDGTGTDKDDTNTDDDEDTDELADYGCHNYDPVEAAGWTRTYDLLVPKEGGGTQKLTEKHTGLGLETGLKAGALSGTNTPFDEAFSYSVAISGAPAYASNATYYNKCGLSGDDGAFEVGFVQQNSAKANFPLKSGAKEARRYLPDEVEMAGVFGASQWSVDMRYVLRSPGRQFPQLTWGYDTNYLDYEGDVAPIGFETINIAALGGNVQAYHVNVTYTMTQVAGPQSFFDIFDTAFAPLTSIQGFVGDDLAVAAVADQWYVRGVGLVKEQVYRYPASALELIREKTLKACTRLPECP